MNKIKYINVIDIEATCEKDIKIPAEIIEIGLTQIEIDTKVIKVSEGILVCPVNQPITKFCTELTTITDEMIDGTGVQFIHAINALQKVYNLKDNIFASWGDYDRKTIEQNCQWHNIKYPFNNLHLNIKVLFAAKYGYSCGVDKACKFLDIPFEGTHHRGIDDSLNIAKILVSLL